MGNGDGSFKTPVAYAAGIFMTGVAVGDFNGDAKPDLAVSDQSTAGVYILLGNGNGTFQPAVTRHLAGGSVSVAVADFNEDGKPDLAVTVISGDVAILEGKADGSFQPPVYLPVPGLTVGLGGSLIVGDFNGDGKPDLAVAGGALSIMLGNGDGSFQPSENFGVG